MLNQTQRHIKVMVQPVLWSQTFVLKNYKIETKSLINQEFLENKHTDKQIIAKYWNSVLEFLS